LIFDLRAAKNLDLVPESKFLLLASEYQRISLVLARARERRDHGWAYLLDFHLAESNRLLQKLRIDRVYHVLLQGYDCKQEELRGAYQMLEDTLTELAERIDQLMYAKNIDLKELT
jgi:hypothetical protein